jgi:protein Mpv17
MNVWFATLNRIHHPNLAIQTAKRVVVDQGVAGPCIPAFFYTSLTLLEGGTLQQVQTRLKDAWFRTWSIGVCVFAPASIINQSVIAPQNRILFISGVALCWNVFLSYTNNKYKQQENS